ncbi:MAG: tRNA uridine(34) 5-carboxymethylaminomethyl modification radical SAM/GNAT enzyme Elp3 [Methanobacteriaceae archaeon]|nr:tRNA uridine(34) 5-carboxymethylaminomethyl modification radical SAM/GNAT enzyme Elp3 [Methanobacteriaceae archaeon]
MENACRFIIERIKSGDITNKKELEKAKHRACRDYNLEKFMSNSLILKYASNSEKKEISKILMKKPTRTLSGVAIVAVMCQPTECPHGRCLYCPESEKAPPSYTGEEPAALRARMYKFHPYKQVYNRLLQLESIGHPLDKVELIIMGGTFPAHFLCYQEWFVTKCIQAMIDFGVKNPSIDLSNDESKLNPSPITSGYFKYLNDIQKANEKSNIRNVGLTFETRPDYCKVEDVDRMLKMGVTRVELGVQTIYNFIYQRVKRGHNVKDVVESTRILRDSGIKVAMHLMPGLFSDFERDMRMFKRVFSDPKFKPDMLKIYPCLVTKGSKLYELWKKGDYKPYTTEEAVDLIVEIKKILPKWVRTMRIQRDIPSPLIEAGVKKSNLGELVYNKIEKHEINCKCIRCREVGFKAVKGIVPSMENIQLIKEEYEAGEGKEIFLSFEDVKMDILIGFLRLRIPSNKSHRPEINEKTALVRELHVYGPMIPLGEKFEDEWQHKGFGEELLAEAERVALESFNRTNILINSGIGVRNYYRKFGYKLKGPYMSKSLH